MEVAMNLCFVCERYDRSTAACSAFEGRPPVSIFDMEHDHREPFPGDRGLTFKPSVVLVSGLSAGTKKELNLEEIGR